MIAGFARDNVYCISDNGRLVQNWWCSGKWMRIYVSLWCGVCWGSNKKKGEREQRRKKKKYIKLRIFISFSSLLHPVEDVNAQRWPRNVSNSLLPCHPSLLFYSSKFIIISSMGDMENGLKWTCLSSHLRHKIPIAKSGRIWSATTEILTK